MKFGSLSPIDHIQQAALRIIAKPGSVKLREGSLTALVSSGGAGVPGDRRLEQQDGVPGLHRAAGGGGLHLGRGWALANSQVGGRREHALSVVSVADIQDYCH